MAYSLDDIRAMRGIDPGTVGDVKPDKKKEKEPKIKIESDSEITQELKEDFCVEKEWTKTLSKFFTAGIAGLFFVLLTALVVKFICLLFF